jgi:hypothetical protein
MTEKYWQDTLHEKYKHLFEQFEDGRIIRGIEVSEGWAKITEDLLESFEWIRTHNLHMNDGKPHVIQIFQIKQKFGVYSVYVTTPTNMNDQIERVIGIAVGKAQLTCERCGAIGAHTPTEGWITILCDSCKCSSK